MLGALYPQQILCPMNSVLGKSRLLYGTNQSRWIQLLLSSQKVQIWKPLVHNPIYRLFKWPVQMSVCSQASAVGWVHMSKAQSNPASSACPCAEGCSAPRTDSSPPFTAVMPNSDAGRNPTLLLPQQQCEEESMTVLALEEMPPKRSNRWGQNRLHYQLHFPPAITAHFNWIFFPRNWNSFVTA